ncbi:MAG TPA: caspase family protein [Chryseosolibacter sp.]|nr:caspase family protein [Chryseosolibacter sp.]
MTRIIPALLLLITVTGFGQNELQTVIQKGHELAVLSIAVSSDSNFIATGSKDKTIKLWDVSSGREVRTFAGHDHWVNSVAFSSDGRFLISGSYDKSVRIWEVGTGKEVFAESGNDFITDVAFDPKMRFFITCGYNRSGAQDSAFIYDLQTKKKITTISINADEGRGFGVSVSISPDGEWIAFGEDNRVINVYRTRDWKLAYNLQAEGWCGGCATFTAFDPGSKFVYAVSHRGPLRKFNLSDGAVSKMYTGKVDDLTGLSVSPDGLWLAVASEKECNVYNASSGELINTFVAEEKALLHRITFSHDSRSIIITSDDNTAFAWNYHSGKRENIFTGFLNERDGGGLTYDPNFSWQAAIAKYIRLKNKIIISHDGKSLIKGKFGKKVKQWDIATGKAVMDFSAHEKAVIAYDLSKDGKRLVTGGGDGTIILWDLQTGDTLRVIRSYREPIFDVQFNEDETHVVSASWDATMKIHDLSNGFRTHYIEFEENSSAYNVGFHPSGLYVLAARLNHSLQLWEPDTRKVVRDFVGHTDVVSSFAFSKDGKTLMSGSWDGTIRLWDVGTGLMTARIAHSKAPVHAAIYSHDEKHIYAAGADRTIRVWDTNTGKLSRSLHGHQSEITSLVFSPDNKMLISHSLDGVTKFWDLSSGREFFEHIHFGETDWMVKNPDGYFNATDRARKYIHFVDGVKTFSVDQFFNEFYRPELLPEIFQSRGATGSFKDIQDIMKGSPPPIVRVAVVAAPEGKAEVLIRITDAGAGVQNLKVFHNGKNISLDQANLNLPRGKGQSTTSKQIVALVGGENAFTVTARNNENIESDPQTATIFSEYPVKSSTCHILAVGINEYKNPKLSLNYARNDAESFSKLVDERGTLFKDIQLHSIYDKEATREKILAKLDELASKIAPEDVFIFYYAGHGSMVENKFYFIPTESLRLYDQNALSREAIEAAALQEKFKHIHALKQLIIMDACQSGGSVELLANRGASEEKAIAQLSRSAGIHVMASAGSEQFATEFAELGHGLFTYVLILGLQGGADGAPKDGKVTIYELKSYIDDQVPELTRKMKGKPQYPYTFSRGHDFPVVIN